MDPLVKIAWLQRTLIALLMSVVVLTYAPGLSGPFVLDDGENITQNDGVAMAQLTPRSLASALTSNDSGLLKRPLAALSFALNYYFSGSFENSFAFKATNLGIHLANTLLVALLAGLLLRTPAFRTDIEPTKPLIAVAVAGIWALHPLQLTSVLYVVQRMTSLSALFVLAGLVAFCAGRLRLEQNRSKGLALMYVGVLAGTVAGLGAKESGALVPLFAATIEFALFCSAGSNVRRRTDLRMFYGLTLILPLSVALAFLLVHPEFVLNPYAGRSFSPNERLLTETRILWHYVGLLLLPDPQRLGLFQDDMVISHGLFDPPQTALALFALFFVFVLALVLSRLRPVIAFGVLWFLTGHLLESTIFGLELAYEHRNYVASFGVFFILVTYLASALVNRPRAGRFLAVVAVSLISGLAFATWVRAHAWSDIRQLAFTEVRHHPHSARSLDFAARVSLIHDRDVLTAIRYTDRGISVAPHEPGFRIDMRILLAILEEQINKSRQETRAIDFAKSNSIALNGAPDTVRISQAGNRIHLSHVAANRNTLESMLAQEPISAHTIVSLDSLSRCLGEADSGCHSLQTELVSWLTAAASNERSTPIYRAIVQSNLARTHAFLGKYEQALEFINRAREIAPSEPAFALGQIEYLLKTNRLAEARRALDTYRIGNSALGPDTTRHSASLNSLESLYAKLSATQPIR